MTLPLSIIGRIAAIKIMVLPRINYLLAMSPTQSKMVQHTGYTNNNILLEKQTTKRKQNKANHITTIKTSRRPRSTKFPTLLLSKSITIPYQMGPCNPSPPFMARYRRNWMPRHSNHRLTFPHWHNQTPQLPQKHTTLTAWWKVNKIKKHLPHKHPYSTIQTSLQINHL